MHPQGFLWNMFERTLKRKSISSNWMGMFIACDSLFRWENKTWPNMEGKNNNRGGLEAYKQQNCCYKLLMEKVKTGDWWDLGIDGIISSTGFGLSYGRCASWSHDQVLYYMQPVLQVAQKPRRSCYFCALVYAAVDHTQAWGKILE